MANRFFAPLAHKRIIQEYSRSKMNVLVLRGFEEVVALIKDPTAKQWDRVCSSV